MATTTYGWDSFYSSQLSSPITASDTTIPLVTAPTAQEGVLVINPSDSTQREIIYYTSVSGNSVVCPSVGAGRGQEGTTARPHSSGVTVKRNTTSRDFEVLQDTTALNFSMANVGAFANPYKFHVTQTSGINVGTAATKMSFTTETFDSNSNYDSATNHRYTAPVAGFYHFYAYARISAGASTTSASMIIYKNGAAFTSLAFEQGTNISYGLKGSILMSLAATDYVEIFISTTGAATTSLASGTDIPYFGGFLISKT